LLIGARGGSQTPKGFRPLDPKLDHPSRSIPSYRAASMYIRSLEQSQEGSETPYCSMVPDSLGQVRSKWITAQTIEDRTASPTVWQAG